MTNNKNILQAVAVLVVVSDSQQHIKEAKKLTTAITETLRLPLLKSKIDTYPKFPHSFKITLFFKIQEQEDKIRCGLLHTARLCTPWLCWYDEEEDTLELIFNRESSTRYTHTALKDIRWGNWTIENIDITE